MDQDLKNDLRIISDRVGNLEVSLARITTTIEIHTENDKVLLLRIQTLLEKHDYILFGNDSPGIKTQVDRLEEKERTRQWSLRALWTVLLSVLVKIFYELFFWRK